MLIIYNLLSLNMLQEVHYGAISPVRLQHFISKHVLIGYSLKTGLNNKYGCKFIDSYKVGINRQENISEHQTSHDPT